MSAQYTPGPWACTTRRGSWDWVVYCETNPNIEICQPFHDGTEFNERGEANSRLIAAAPEGHELIGQLEESFTADGTYQQFLPAMRAYLAKVRGQ